MPDKCQADFENHSLIRRNRERDRAWKEFKRFRNAISHRRRNHRIDPLRQLKRDVFCLMGISIRRHMGPMRFRRSSWKNDRLSFRNDFGDLHLRHARHATLHIHTPALGRLADRGELPCAADRRKRKCYQLPRSLVLGVRLFLFLRVPAGCSRRQGIGKRA